MRALTNGRFWFFGSILAAVPVAAMIRDHGLYSFTGWPERVLNSYETWRDLGVSYLGDLLMLLADGVRGMAEDAVNLVIILLALYLATLLAGVRDNDEASENEEETGEAGRSGRPPQS